MIADKVTIKAVRKALGRELWQKRQERNLSLAELSRKTGLPAKSLDRGELGRGVPVYVLIKMVLFYDKKIKIELMD